MSDASGTITKVGTYAPANVGFMCIAGIGTVFAFDLETATGRAGLNCALAAQAQGLSVDVNGTGTTVTGVAWEWVQAIGINS